MHIYLLVVVLAGLTAMDTTSGPQVFISEPIISCSALGLLFGKPETGLMIGMFFQLAWFGYLPLGAVRFTDSNMAALVSTSSVLLAGELFAFSGITESAAIIPALLFGVVTGSVGNHLRTLVRRTNSTFSDRVLSRLEQGEIPSIMRWHLAGVGISFTRGVIMAVVLIPLGTVLCGLTALVPAPFIDGMAISVPMIWGTACAAAVFVMVRKGNVRALLYGCIGGVLWILMVI